MHDLPAPFDQLPENALRPQLLAEKICLFRQGEPPRAIFYLEHGEIVLLRYTTSGDEIIIHVARSGETFAEAALFSGQYHCDAIVRQQSSIVEISKAAVLRTAQQNTRFSLALVARFSQQVQRLRSHKELLAIRSATERVYVAINEGMLQGSVKQFAASIGLTHEVVYRALAELVKKGRLLKHSRGQYIIPENP